MEGHLLFAYLIQIEKVSAQGVMVLVKWHVRSAVVRGHVVDLDMTHLRKKWCMQHKNCLRDIDMKL